MSSSKTRTVADFNRKHPIGTKVRVFPGTRDGRSVETVTTHEAIVLGGHTPAVYVAGVPGQINGQCFSLTHVDVLR